MPHDHDQTVAVRRRPATLTVAAALAWLVAVALAGLGVVSVAQLHGRFSAGVGVMLLAYAAIVAWVGWAAWRCRFYARGMLVTVGLLHLLVAVGSFSSSPVLWGAVGLVSAATLACALLPATTAALGTGRPTS